MVSPHVNGEVVVIDGGEWLKGAVNLICWSIRGTLGPTGNDDKSKEE
jgi:hypothetical protein